MALRERSVFEQHQRQIEVEIERIKLSGNLDPNNVLFSLADRSTEVFKDVLHHVHITPTEQVRREIMAIGFNPLFSQLLDSPTDAREPENIILENHHPSYVIRLAVYLARLLAVTSPTK